MQLRPEGRTRRSPPHASRCVVAGIALVRQHATDDLGSTGWQVLRIAVYARCIVRHANVAICGMGHRDDGSSSSSSHTSRPHAYRPRVVDQEIDDRLRSRGAVVIEDQPAWTPHLRSRSRARTAPKRHFVDPSLAAAALGATPHRLLRDVGTLGLLFESLVIRDLRIYAQSFEAAVLHYRDNTGLEVDAIVETPDGAWAAFEIKLGQARIDDAATNLLKFADRVDDRRTGERAPLVVITGTGYAYDRPDGVAVVPIGALGP